MPALAERFTLHVNGRTVTGARVRQVPFTAERVRRAMEAAAR
ncbi:MAG TPA: hypothetical protein VIK93_00530 [Limnochordales bacterium]